MKKKPAPLTKADLSKCIHHRGFKEPVCAAGIDLQALAATWPGTMKPAAWIGNILPCVPSTEGHGIQRVECALCERPSLESIEAEEQEMHAYAARSIMALVAVKEQAESLGILRVGRNDNVGGKGEIDPCPACGTGKLRYRIAPGNGHAAAKCSTPGCISFME